MFPDRRLDALGALFDDPPFCYACRSGPRPEAAAGWYPVAVVASSPLRSSALEPSAYSMTDSMGITTFAKRVEVSAHTLRYYEAAGLMIPVPRDAAGRRRYNEDHARWVGFLRRLRDGGMGIAKVRQYAKLTQSSTEDAQAERLALLREHRDEVESRIRSLSLHLEVLERKVAQGCSPAHGLEPTEESP